MLKKSSGKAPAPKRAKRRSAIVPGAKTPFQHMLDEFALRKMLVWSARPDGSVDYLNARLLENVGKTADEMLGWSWSSTLHPEDVERSLDRLERSLCYRCR